MKDIYIDNKSINLCDGDCKIVFDTGTSIITGPSDDLKKLLNLIPEECENLDNLPELGFRIGDLLYTMKPKDYLLFPSTKPLSEQENLQNKGKINSQDNKDKLRRNSVFKSKTIEDFINENDNNSNTNSVGNNKSNVYVSQYNNSLFNNLSKDFTDDPINQLYTKVNKKLENGPVKKKDSSEITKTGEITENSKSLVELKNDTINFLENRTSVEKNKILCKRAFMPLDVKRPHGPLWVVGDIFFRKYFVIFDRDQKRIGIALRNKNK